MSDIKLGDILPDSETERDAVHMAVIPVVAAQILHGGQHVAFVTPGKLEVGPPPEGVEPVGVIDPFIKGYIQKGERVFLLMYPQTVTVVRHAWTHPDVDGRKSPPNAVAVAEAMAYLDLVAKEFAIGTYTPAPPDYKGKGWWDDPRRKVGYTADEVIKLLTAFVSNGSYTRPDGDEPEQWDDYENCPFSANSPHDLPKWWNEAKMWESFTLVTGLTNPGHRQVISFCC